MNTSINNRYNLFNYIHKGIRAMLYDTAMALQQTDFNNRNEAISVFEKITGVLYLASDHSWQENKFILPVIAKYDQDIVKKIEGEHLTDESMTHRLQNLIALYFYAISNEEKLDTGDAVFKAFNDFIAFNMSHMNKEEDILNSLLWQNYSDKELFGIQSAITASMPVEKMAMKARWIMRGINNAEIIEWLLAIKDNTRENHFQKLLQLAEDELPEERWSKIKEFLCEGEMLNC